MVAPVTSDLLFRCHSSSGKLAGIDLRELNRINETWEAKEPLPRLSREIRAQEAFRCTPHRSVAVQSSLSMYTVYSGVPRVYGVSLRGET